MSKYRKITQVEWLTFVAYPQIDTKVRQLIELIDELSSHPTESLEMLTHAEIRIKLKRLELKGKN